MHLQTSKQAFTHEAAAQLAQPVPASAKACITATQKQKQQLQASNQNPECSKARSIMDRPKAQAEAAAMCSYLLQAVHEVCQDAQAGLQVSHLPPEGAKVG